MVSDEVHERERNREVFLQAHDNTIFMAGVKRPRVTLADLRMQQTDGPVVRRLFERLHFDAKGWLANLPEADAKLYLKEIESKRSIDLMALETLHRVPDFVTLTTELEHAQKRYAAVQEYVHRLIMDSIGAFKKGEWTALVRHKAGGGDMDDL